MDIITLALAKSFATKVSAGYSNVEVDGTTIIFTLNDGTTTSLTVPTPADGVSVVDLDINENNELICTMSDGTSINAGEVPVADLSEYAKTDYVDEKDELITKELEKAKMVYNTLPKVSETGTSITMNNTAECPMYSNEISPSALEQKTTTGKNLLNINYLTTISTTYVSYDINIPAGTYILSSEKITTLGEYSSLLAFRNGSTVVAQETLSSSSLSKSITFSSDVNKVWIYSQDTYAHSQNVSTTFEGLMISANGGDYESYTGGQSSPNPQYPQTVHTISGENSIKMENKNLFNIQDLVKGRLDNGVIGYETGTTSITLNANSFSFTTNANYRGVCTNSYIQLQPETIYNFNSDTSSGITVALDCYDENKTYLSRPTAILQQDGSRNFTTPANTKYGRIGITLNTTGTITIKNPQFEQSSTATSYTQHQEQNFLISLGDLEYCKIGNYEDLFFKNVIGSEYYDSTLELDKWYLKKNTLKYESLNTCSWTLNSGIFYASINIRKTDTTNTQNIYCSVYKWNGNYLKLSSASTNMNNNEIATNNNGTSTNVFIRDDRFETTDYLKNYLSTNNIFAYIVLATPSNILLNSTLQTQLDNIAKAISYQEQTNVSQTNNDLPFVLSFTAIKDLSSL